MDPAPLIISPSSDERFWTKLRDRVDTILEERKPKPSIERPPSACGIESETGKRFREDSLLLIRGLDSAAASLSQLTNSLNAAQQGLSDLAKPSPTKVHQRESQGTEDEDVQPNAKKRHCGRNKLPDKADRTGSDKPVAVLTKEEAGFDGFMEKKQILVNVGKSGNLKKAKNLAIAMATKAASHARELKMIKSELCFMQERCTLLEEENRRLREGLQKGVRPEEEDLVRLQLEALLAEKSRLANENANLTRENQCLHQLVEYHQLTSQDPPSPSYEQVIRGTCLDFSSPVVKIDHNSEDENGCGESEFPCTPPLDEEHCEEQQP